MKYLSFLIFFSSLLGQQPNPIQRVFSDPTGNSCAGTMVQLYVPVGNIYTCQSGTMEIIGGLSSPTGGTSNLVSRDTNGNTFINNELVGTNGNACTGTITLTAASARIQTFTSGSGTCNVVLPNATTLESGVSYEFNNNASGVITVEMNGGTTLTTMLPGSYVRTFLISNSFSAGQWDYHWYLPTNVQWGTLVTTLPLTVNFNGATISTSTPPTITGCGTISSQVGGALAGTFVTSTTSCTPVLTNLPITPNGYFCIIVNQTAGTGTLIGSISSTTTTATFPTFVTVATNVLAFNCGFSF